MGNEFNNDNFIFYDDSEELTDISSIKNTDELVTVDNGNNNTSGSSKKGKHTKEEAKQNKTKIKNNLKQDKNSKDSKDTDDKTAAAKKKNIITICSAVGVVFIGLIVAGVSIFAGKNTTKPVITDITPTQVVKENFKFSENTTVSGISIAGKTYDEAYKLLGQKEKTFIPAVTLNIKANDKTYNISQKDFEYTFDTEKVLENIAKFQESGYSANTENTYKITAKVKDESIKKVSDKIKGEVDKAPINARVSKFTPYNGDDRFEYAEAEVGYTLDGADLTKKIKSVVTSGLEKADISAIVEKVEAEIQIDEVKKNIVELATYHTVSYNTANGTSNMGVALEACNGSVIEPGETWSFNACTGDSNLESNGYKPAHVIIDSKITDGIGGGICQASSTIYNAALRSNLTIEERYNHTFASSYVPAGLDATIDYPNLDLKLTNSTKYQVFLECKLSDTTLTVTFWGYQDPKYDTITTENEIGPVENGKYKTKAWRVYYKDGKEVDREQLGSSTYESSGGYGGGSASNDNGASTGTTITGNSTSTVIDKPATNNNTPTQPPTQTTTQAPVTTQPVQTEPPTEAIIQTEPQPTTPVVDNPPVEPTNPIDDTPSVDDNPAE